MRTQPIVLELEVESAIEVERRAILVELRAQPPVIAQDEVDLLRTGQERTPDASDRHAFRALALFPLDLSAERPRLNRNAKDDLVLDDEACDRRTHDRGLRGEDAEQQGHERKDRPRNHWNPTAIAVRFAAKR